MRDFQAELEHWANMLPPPGTPRIARMKAGRIAYYAMLRNFAPRPGKLDHRTGTGYLTDFTGVPVDVLDGPSWPPNLLVAIDHEGNAMKAWILND